jgi:flagellar biosynthetic protein FlhB
MPEKEQKTEQPTSKRLSEARKRGEIAQAEELLSAASIIALVSILIFRGQHVVDWSMIQMREAFSCNTDSISSSRVFASFANGKIVDFVILMIPFWITLMIAGIATSVSINGFNVASKALKWKFSSLNPISGFKKVFISVNSIIKLGLSLIKIIFITLIVSTYVSSKINLLATFQWVWTRELLALISSLILGVLIRICFGLLIIGFADLIYRKWKYIQDLKMTKQEVKDERTSSEGAPEIKKRIRSEQFKRAVQRMLQNVPKANVVLVNPTHVAVALRYDPDTMAAPIVVAKGGDHLCEKIKEIARAYGVPIIRRPAIARELYATVEVEHPIPDKLFVVVAEVLALIYRLRHNR